MHAWINFISEQADFSLGDVNSLCCLPVAVTNSRGSVSGRTWSWISRCAYWCAFNVCFWYHLLTYWYDVFVITVCPDTRLWFEPGPFCAWVQQANHSAAESPLLLYYCWNVYVIVADRWTYLSCCTVQMTITVTAGGSVAEWLACWTQAQKGLGSNRSRDAVW